MKRALLLVAVGATVMGPSPAFVHEATAASRPPAEAAARRPQAPRPPVRRALRPVVRYAGAGAWSLADVDMVQQFFARRFGRPLPVSAWGQTVVHDRLGLDHRDAFDVALHPDSAEGRALMAFLRSEGIPFVGVRSRIRGLSTGAHIHVGPESGRLPRPRQPVNVARSKPERSALRAPPPSVSLLRSVRRRARA